MKKVSLFYILFFLFASCDLWEDYKVNFIDIVDTEVVKYDIGLKDSATITDYKKYINEKLIETVVFYSDTIKTERITFDVNNNIIFRRTYKFDLNTFASETVDTAFFKDSMCVTITEYDYNNGFISREYSETKGINCNYSNTITYKYTYGKNNIVKRDITKGNSRCVDELIYTDVISRIDIIDFTNNLLGKRSENLVEEIFWESSCYKQENIAKPLSIFIYELNEDGYVTKRTEKLSPYYDTTLDNNIERLVSTVFFEYHFY